MEIRPSSGVAIGDDFKAWALHLDGNAPAVARAALHLSSTLDLDEALSIAVMHLDEALDGLPFVVVVPGEDERKRPRLAVGGGPWSSATKAAAESLLRESLPESNSAETRVVVNWDASSSMPVPSSGEEPLSSQLRSVTLVAHGSPLGVIGVALPSDFVPKRTLERMNALRVPIALALYNAMTHARLRGLAFRDCLTGLYNRRAFEEMMEIEVAHARRHSRPLSLLALDVDHLKGINDRFGHDAGDVVLAEVAKILSRLVRDCDLPARTGGDEFSVILPNTGRGPAEFIALRLRAGLQCNVAVPGVGALHVAVSIGIACCAEGEVLHAITIRRSADEALYGEKKHHTGILQAFLGTPDPDDEMD